MNFTHVSYTAGFLRSDCVNACVLNGCVSKSGAMQMNVCWIAANYKWHPKPSMMQTSVHQKKTLGCLCIIIVVSSKTNGCLCIIFVTMITNQIVLFVISITYTIVKYYENIVSQDRFAILVRLLSNNFSEKRILGIMSYEDLIKTKKNRQKHTKNKKNDQKEPKKIIRNTKNK
jgi:hypothetical protein